MAEYLIRRFRVAHEMARRYVKSESKIRVGPQDRRFQKPFKREFILYANAFDEVAKDKFVQMGLDTTNDFEVHSFAPQVPPIPNNMTGRYCISPDELNDYLDEIGGTFHVKSMSPLLLEMKQISLYCIVLPFFPSVYSLGVHISPSKTWTTTSPQHTRH